MFEKAPAHHAEHEPTPAEKLFAYISSLPRAVGDLPTQGQVQLRLPDSDVFQDSAIYAPKLENGQLTFQAANERGELITYHSIDGSDRNFVSTEDVKVEAVFPDFAE
jgi:hypothetical protein